MNRQLAEDRLQQECYMWFHNTYPSLRGLLNYNLNNSANAIQGNKNKAMGLQPGRSDMELNYMGKTYFIELKVIGGKQSKLQKEWQSLVTSHSFVYVVVWSLNEFKSTVEHIINLSAYEQLNPRKH